MVALHRRQYGRGPANAKTYAIDGMIVAVLGDPYTHVERTLIGVGRQESVRDTRLAHQLAMRDEFVEPVERLTGRRVDGFVSTVAFDPDVAIEIFFMGEELEG